jgi:hypothetical protein
MPESDPQAVEKKETENSPRKKKPYQRPAFQHERVFETLALTCGKIGPTQGQCHSSRKNS